MARLSAFVIGSPGVVDPRTGDPQLAVNLPAWHEGALDALRGVLHKPVMIENDVNLAAMAERAAGAAAGADDFVLVWIGGGLGLATFLGGQVHRGTAGRRARSATCPCTAPRCRTTSGTRPTAACSPWSAGTRSTRCGRPRLRGRDRRRGRPGRGGRPRRPARPPAAEFLDELAHRVAIGVASVCVVLDPGLVVLGGNVGMAGGAALADRVAAEVARICPARPRVVPTAVPGEPVLRGAMLAAVDQAREDLLDSVADPGR